MDLPLLRGALAGIAPPLLSGSGLRHVERQRFDRKGEHGLRVGLPSTRQPRHLKTAIQQAGVEQLIGRGRQSGGQRQARQRGRCAVHIALPCFSQPAERGAKFNLRRSHRLVKGGQIHRLRTLLT